ncbi:hypothetical protein SCHPADRAFT_906814 [Schizopora paradoxa]|uniref:Uncharacterized protein n=1 Tax=Schizopora paradoxa TaxID=27342 RepID=A0A0H2RM11_9AGAM|nr:hypothetical protein SCHPADRAFT_906814 [Schizopora paradoxa]
MFWLGGPEEHERACQVLLICARSNDVNIQIEAFKRIVQKSVKHPKKVRSAFRRVFERRKEISDVTTFSWKRPGVEYSVKWLFWYRLASRCLSSHQSSFIEETVQLEGVRRHSLDFSRFEGLLLSCGDSSGLQLALRFIDWFWNREGITYYIRYKGFEGSALVQFANGLRTWWEIYFSVPDTAERVHISYLSFDLGSTFLESISRSSGKLDDDEPKGRFMDEALLPVWADVYKIHQFLRRASFLIDLRDHPIVCKPWGDLCRESLPNPNHEKLRKDLLRLEDIYGSEMRNRFSPEKYSAIGLEQKYFANATRAIPGLLRCANCSTRRELESSLRRRHWSNPSWYDDQLEICDEMMIVTESSTIIRTTSAGLPYVIRIGQAAANACNICYHALLRRWQFSRRRGSYLPLSPIVVIFTHHRGILTFFILHVAALDTYGEDGGDVLKSFEGGFRLHRKDTFHV